MSRIVDAPLLIWQLFWPSLVIVAAFALLERMRPLEAHQSWRPWLFNLVWHALFLAIFVGIMMSGWARLVSSLAAYGAAPLIAPAASGPALWGRIAVAIIVQDALVYGGHRLMHALPVLWAFHRFHHDERNLNASTSLRQHWLTIPLHQMVVFLPLCWLFGIGATPVEMFYVLAVAGAFHHANLRIELGCLTPWIVGPQVHRMHHARDAASHGSNYGSLFPWWDRLLGTWQTPVRGDFRATGLVDCPPSSSLGNVLLRPLQDWWRLLRPLSVSQRID